MTNKRHPSFSRRQALVPIVCGLLFWVPNITNYLAYAWFSTPDIAVRPMTWNAVTGFVLLCVAKWRSSFSLPILTFIGYLGFRMLDALFFNRMGAAASVSFFTLGLSCMFVIISWLAFNPLYSGRASMAAAAVVSLLTIFVSLMIDVAVPGTFSITAGRAAGWILNPNGAGMAVVTLAAVAIATGMLKPWGNLVVIVISALGVFVTLSRGAMVMLVIFVLTYFLRSGLKQRMLAIFMVAGTSLGLFFGYRVIEELKMKGQVTTESRERMLTGRDWENYNNTDRLDVLLESVALGLKSPLVGYGAMYSAEPATISGQGPHNQVVAAWLDEGLIGLVGIIAIVVTLWSQLRKGDRRHLPLFVCLIVGFLFSHNLTESLVFLFAWTAACALVADDNNRVRMPSSLQTRLPDARILRRHAHVQSS